MSPYIVAIGSTAVDEYYRCNSWPVMGDKAFVRFLEKRLGGMISNAACVMANYGTPTYLLDVLGQDEDTGLILEELQEYGVLTGLIQVHEELRNTKAMIFLSKGERSILIVDNQKPLGHLIPAQLEIMDGAQFHYSSINDFKQVPDHQRWMPSARQKPSPSLVFDVEPNSFESADTDQSYFAAATHLLFNEAGFLKWQGNDSHDSAVSRLFHGETKSLVITLAERGCRLITRETDRVFPGIPVKPVDTTGAGDTFNATWLTAILKGCSEIKACQIANRAAARSIEFMGARSGAVPWETIFGDEE
jgi:ribokinase